MSKSTGGALEWLAVQADVLYLSDLRPQYRTHALTRSLRRALEWVDPERFPAASWCDAVEYLLDRPCRGLTAVQAATLLRGEL